MVRQDDDWPDQIEFDPRWEVQPRPEPDDDPGRSKTAAVVAAVAMTVFVVVLAWLLANAPPVAQVPGS